MSRADKALLTLLAVGDVTPNREDPPSLFRHCRDLFSKADIVFGQMEAPLSERGTPIFTHGSPIRLPSKNATALTEKGAGFDVMSFASNHTIDWGWDAMVDTLDVLKKNNIATVGAGMNIKEARTPAILNRDGTRVGFLAYLSIIKPGLVAEADRPGCPPLRVNHSYLQGDPQPGTPPEIITALFPNDKKAMEEDIKKLRSGVDVLVVYMHAGVHFVPAMIAMYQKEAAYAAVEAGADLVLMSHAHICKGIEIYRGKAIFYGLGNFALEHSRPYPGKVKHLDEMYKPSREYYRIKIEPGWEKYPHHPDSRKTMIVKAYIQDKKIQKVTYIPTYINREAEPEIVARNDPRAQEVFDYIAQISDKEDLKANFSWDGNEVLVSEPKRNTEIKAGI